MCLKLIEFKDNLLLITGHESGVLCLFQVFQRKFVSYCKVHADPSYFFFLFFFFLSLFIITFLFSLFLFFQKIIVLCFDVFLKRNLILTGSAENKLGSVQISENLVFFFFLSFPIKL